MDFFRRGEKEDFKISDFKPRELPLTKKIKCKEVKEGGGRWIFGLLLGSILLSVGFFLWGRFAQGEGFDSTPPDDLISISLTNPTSVPTPTPIIRKTDKVVSQIKEETQNLKGGFGVYVFNLTTKQTYGLSEDEVFMAASLIKLPVLLVLYQEAEAGRIDLDAKYVLKQADKQGGAGSMQYKPAGTVYTYRKMAELMGQQSDNTAFMVTRNLLGDEKIQTAINKLGMAKTSLRTNETSPSDIGLFFRKLYGGSLLTREHRDELLNFLTKTAFEDRIPAGLPADVRVAHKIGSEIGVYSDGGIVFAPKPFVLVILSKGIIEREAKLALPQTTKTVWEFETE
ncbi:MAG: serine hydrolase [bacterium]|nr:serine hydrolase [bacterium]